MGMIFQRSDSLKTLDLYKAFEPEEGTIGDQLSALSRSLEKPNGLPTRTMSLQSRRPTFGQQTSRHYNEGQRQQENLYQRLKSMTPMSLPKIPSLSTASQRVRSASVPVYNRMGTATTQSYPTVSSNPVPPTAYSPSIRIHGNGVNHSSNPNVPPYARRIPTLVRQAHNARQFDGPVLKGDGTDMKGMLPNCMLPAHLLVPSVIAQQQTVWQQQQDVW